MQYIDAIGVHKQYLLTPHLPLEVQVVMVGNPNWDPMDETDDRSCIWMVLMDSSNLSRNRLFGLGRYFRHLYKCSVVTLV